MGDFRFHGMQWMRVEMSHRVKQAWASWHKFRIALTDPRIHLRLRLRAFESLISSVILYGCRTWSLTNHLKSQLDNVERSMLAKIMHCPAHMRRLAPGTSFVDRARLKRKLIVRALKSRHNARQPSSTHPQRGSICWVERVTRAQWMWALRVAQKPESSLVSLAVQCYPHTVHPLGRRTCSLHHFSLGMEHDSPEHFVPQWRSAVQWHDRVGAAALSGTSRRGARTFAWLSSAKSDELNWFKQMHKYVSDECKCSGLYKLLSVLPNRHE